MNKNAPDKEALRAVLAEYDGPWEPVKAYVPEASLPILWIGGERESAQVTSAADYYCCKPLSAVVRLSGRDEVIWHSDGPLVNAQRALLPIRREAFDKHWLPWAQEHGAHEATVRLDAALNMTQAWLDGDMGLSELDASRAVARSAASNAARAVARAGNAAWDAASRAVGASEAMTFAAAWTVAWAMARNTAWDVASNSTWDKATNVAWSEINARIERHILWSKR